MIPVGAVVVGGIGLLIAIDAAFTSRNRVAVRLAPYMSRTELATGFDPGQRYGPTSRPHPELDRRRAVDHWTLICACAGGAVALVGIATGTPLIGVVAGAGIVPGGLALSRRQARLLGRIRTARIRAEVPTVADLMTIAVSAGETLWKAIDHAAEHCAGPLSEELSRALDEIHAGKSFQPAMQELADRVGDSGLRRLIETVVVSQERGSPVSESLRALSADLREERRRELMSESGTRQVLMLLPVVALVLPAALLIAFWPALTSLQQLVGGS